MKWFGEPWPSEELRAPVCEDDAERTDPPPPGTQCSLCGQGFMPNAQGVEMPHLTADKTSPWMSWAEKGYVHIDCLVSNVTGFDR